MSAEHTHPWRIATQCGNCFHALPIKANVLTCANLDSPTHGKIVGAGWGCCSGTPRAETTGDRVPVLVPMSTEMFCAVAEYAPVHGGTIASAIRKAVKCVYQGEKFHNLNPDDHDHARMVGCEMACAEG